MSIGSSINWARFCKHTLLFIRNFIAIYYLYKICPVTHRIVHIFILLQLSSIREIINKVRVIIGSNTRRIDCLAQQFLCLFVPNLLLHRNGHVLEVAKLHAKTNLENKVRNGKTLKHKTYITFQLFLPVPWSACKLGLWSHTTSGLASGKTPAPALAKFTPLVKLIPGCKYGGTNGWPIFVAACNHPLEEKNLINPKNLTTISKNDSYYIFQCLPMKSTMRRPSVNLPVGK